LSQITRVTDGQTDRRTDRQTDRILLAIPRLHYMQRGKNKLETRDKIEFHFTSGRFVLNICMLAFVHRFV